MAECKFTDEEIIKALELCIQNAFCESCEYREKTDKSDICPIRTDALNLINKQNAEIETLKDNNEHLAVMLEEAKSKVERLQAKKDALIKNYAECMKDYAGKIFAEVNMQIFPYSTDIYIKGEELIIIPKSDYNAILTELKKKYTEGE